MKNELIVKEINFLGSTLVAAKDKEGVIWAAVKWICEGLGLTEGQIKSERLKLREDLVLLKGGRNFVLPTKGGNQEVLCLQLDFVPLWLAKISITPSMQENNPDLVNRLVEYQLKAKDVLAEAFLKNPATPKPKNLSAINMMVKNMSGLLEKAGVDPLFIVAESKRIYGEAGYTINIPLITDSTMPKLYDCTEIAKELGILSLKGNPHNQAVSAIIKQLSVSADEMITTAFSRNGHEDVTTQYKPSVFNKVKAWLDANNYPARISNGIKAFAVVYKEVA